MLKQAKKVLEAVKEIEDKFGTIEEGLKALLLEKKLEEIFGKERFQGAWLRELGENKFSFGHPSCTIHVERTAGNSFTLILTPYKKP